MSMSNCHKFMVLSPEAMNERATRITRLIERPRLMTPEAAARVVDAAMFGIGCVEGTIRQQVQKKLDAEAQNQ